MKLDRARTFLFEPSRFKNDSAVMKMSLPARGAYAILFCEAWDMPEPGVLPDDDDLLCVLSRTDPESWSEVRDEVATAFDTESTPGFWVQKGLVATYESQKSWYSNQVESGRIGGLKAAYKGRLKGASRPAVAIGKGREGKVLTEEKKEKDSDSVPVSESDNGQVNPVRTRTGKPVNPEPADETWSGWKP